MERSERERPSPALPARGEGAGAEPFLRRTAYRGKKDEALRSDERTMERAKKLRREMTPPERILWSFLRSSPAGIRFRRQHPLGPYIADFYCHAAALVIEIDGPEHRRERLVHDARRDAWMVAHGIRTVRVSAQEVMRCAYDVARSCLEIAQERIAER